MGDTDKKSDPLSCTMSLGDHLEELRARLILAIMGLALGAVVSLIFGAKILRFIETPYTNAMRTRIEKTEPPAVEPNAVAFVELLFTNLADALASDANAPEIDPNWVPFLRKVCVETARGRTLEAQAAAAEKGGELPRSARLQTLAPAEAFVAYMKVSFIAGLILTCPWVFYQLWMFVAAGLFEHERRYVRTAVPFSAGLFVIGALFFLFVVAPISLNFFLKFGDIVGVASNWTLQRYISFVTMLMLVFGIGFQTPVAIFILNRTGLVSLAALRSARKYVLLGVFVVAAVATPPDIISQITLAIPLYGLYELGMILAYLAGKKAERKKEKENEKNKQAPSSD